MSNVEDNFFELEDEEDILDDMPDEDDDEDDEDDVLDLDIENDIDDELDEYLGKFKNDEEDYESDDDISTIDDDDISEKKVKETKVRVTFPILTKYEKNFILGFRTKQITNGSVICVDINKIKEKTPYNIALEELKQGLMPLKIKRHLPNGTYEVWDITELIIT